MSAADRIPTAVLGAGGYVGQHFARLLADHPRFAPPLLIGGSRTRGARLREIWRLPDDVPPVLADERLGESGPSELARQRIRVVFSALPSGSAGPTESELARRGIDVYTNASDHRMDPSVPLLIPEVNPGHTKLLVRRTTRGRLVANPNCTATGLALALAPVVAALRPQSVHVATYQALSGAGWPGLSSLAIADNVLPFIPEEEEKVARETARLLGRVSARAIQAFRPPIVVQCARVGVRDGHLEAVTVVARARPGLDDLLESWRTFDPLRGRNLPTAPTPPIVLRSEEDRPQPALDRWAGSPDSARGMAAVIGRIRWDPPFLRFFVLTHNAVRGAAGGSVLNAEFVGARPDRSRSGAA